MLIDSLRENICWWWWQVGISAKYRKLNALECGGHFVLSSFEDFNKIEEEEIMKCLAKVSLDDKSFKKVKKLSCDVAIGSTKNAALGLASEPWPVVITADCYLVILHK